MVDALVWNDDEGRSSLRKASGRWQATCNPEISEWGNPALIASSRTESIGAGSKPRELKHQSTWCKGHQSETPSVVASEGGPGQWRMFKNRNRLERRALVGDSPVRVERTCVLE